jgi:hypothetical protein
MEPGDLIAFPTFPTDVQRLARNVAREISAHGAAQEFRPVRVVEVADETYTHPADAPLDSAHLERGETYVKVYFEFFEPTLEELEEAGGFRERP